MSFRPDRDRTLIIGFGNSLRGDDGAGPLAAARLSACGYHALAVRQLTPELAEPISRAGRVIFIDAHAGLPPGEIAVDRIGPAELRGPVLGHFAGPAGLLRLAGEAYGAAPEAWLISIGARDFGFGEGITGEVRRAVRLAVRAARRLFGVNAAVEAGSAMAAADCVHPEHSEEDI